MNILVVGAGYVGGALAENLLKAGHQVTVVNRRQRALPEGMKQVLADVSIPETLSALPRDIEVAVYAVAAKVHTDEGYVQAYVNGLRNVVTALQVHCPTMQRLIFTSSSSVYGQDAGEWVDETSPTEPLGFTGIRMLEAEQVCLTSGYTPVVVRLSGVYGPGRHRSVEDVRSGQAGYVVGPPRYTNRVHRDDCAGVIEHLLTMSAPESIYIGSDCEPTDRSEVLRWLAAQLGCPPPKAIVDAPPESRQFGSSKRLSNQRLLDSGYTFRFPTFREGYAQIIEQLGVR